MRLAGLARVFAVAVLPLLGCGGGTAAPAPKPFELDGAWVYLGPSDGPHDLTIAPGSMVFTDVGGQWSSTWTVKAYDNALHHFQLTFQSGMGTYLPVGQNLSGTYDLSGSLLTMQVADGLTSYPALQGAGTCTGATDGTPIPDCRLYIKQN